MHRDGPACLLTSWKSDSMLLSCSVRQHAVTITGRGKLTSTESLDVPVCAFFVREGGNGSSCGSEPVL